MTETFIYVGDGMGCPEPGSLVGSEYQAEDGRRGLVIDNSLLSVTVKFPDPPRLVERAHERVLRWRRRLSQAFAAVALMLAGCNTTEMTERAVPLRSVTVWAVTETGKMEGYLLDDADVLEMTVTRGFRDYKKGDRVTVFFKHGQPYLRIVQPR